MPDNEDWPETLKLPPKIVTKKTSRMKQAERQARDPNQADGFESKVICYRKNWRQNADIEEDDNAAEEQEQEQEQGRILKCVWHRDISAAKLILYKGESLIELN